MFCTCTPTGSSNSMECESPSSQQVRAVQGNSQVSLGYTRAQVHAPLPHSHSSTGWNSSDQLGSVSPQQQRQSSSSSRSQHRQSSYTATSPQSISAQQPTVFNRPVLVNSHVELGTVPASSHQHSRTANDTSSSSSSSQARGGATDLSSLGHRHNLSSGANNQATDLASHPAVSGQYVALNNGPPEATQSGSMNMPLYPSAHMSVSGTGPFHPHSHHSYMSNAPAAFSLQTPAAAVNLSDQRAVSERAGGGGGGAGSGGGVGPVANDSAVSGRVRTSATDRGDDSPMVGVCVQQSPVASH